jgi:hypothetical protein
MGELLLELKPLAVVAAVVSIVWLTAMSNVEPRREGQTTSDRYEEQMADLGDELEAWNGGRGLVNLEVEAE